MLKKNNQKFQSLKSRKYSRKNWEISQFFSQHFQNDLKILRFL